MPYNTGDILLDKYRIEEIIGKGAFGEVYRVTHLKLNALRALKVLRKDAPGLGSTEYGEYQDRFKLEAQLGAKLNHPSFIQVHDFEMNGEDLLLVMEYAAGGNLSKRIEQAKQSVTPMPLGTVLAIAEEVAEGLAKLHEIDVVHRDLKPSNILFDEKGHAKVADFGLAQIPGGSILRSQLSNPPPHPGTPAYMSPEQKNSTDYLTPASDVYALGLVLFEMLTGRVYRSQRPGRRASSLREDIPLWLDTLLVSMLLEKPEDRPWDGNEVLGKLRDGKQVDDEKQKAEREAAEKVAREKAKRELAKKAKLEKEQRQVARTAGRRKNIAAFFSRIKSTLKKATPVLIVVGVVVIIILLFLGGSLAIPHLLFLIPTPRPSATVTPTITPVPPTMTFVPTAIKTEAPTATPRPSTFSIYDDFSNGSLSNPYDTALWGNPSNQTAIDWQNGYLIFSGTNCDCVLPSNSPSQWRIDQIGKLQADLRIDKVTGGYGFTKIQILTNLSDGKGTWWAQCRVGSYDGKSAQILCDSYRYGDTFIVSYQTVAYSIEFGKFYTVAIELAPDASTVNYYVDDKEIGSYKPPEKDLLINANFTWQIGLFADSGVSATGAIDNVMVGIAK